MARPQPKTDQSLEGWLVRQSELALKELGRPIDVLSNFRVSSKAPSAFIPNLEAGLQIADQDDPDVQSAKAVGGMVVERTTEGAQTRRQLGTLEVRMSMLKGGEHSRQLVGYLTRFGQKIYVYLMASAAAANLEDSEYVEDRGNAAVETVRQCVRILSQCGRRAEKGFRLAVEFTDETRAARSRPQAAKLLATLREYNVRFVMRRRDWELHSEADQTLLDLIMGMAVTDKENRVRLMGKGRLHLLAMRRIPDSIGPQVPFTHDAKIELRHDQTGKGRIYRDKHALGPKPEAGEVLNALITDVVTELRRTEAAGRKTADWDSLATKLSHKYQLEDRSHEAFMEKQEGNTVRMLHELENPGIALKRLIGPRYINAWRTGRLEYNTTVSVEPEVAETVESWADHVEREGNRVKIRTWVECPKLREIDDIPQDDWELILKWISPSSSRAGKPARGYQRVFRSDRWVELDQDDCEYEYCIVQEIDNVYHLERRPLHLATDERGRRRGWPTGKLDGLKRTRDGVERLCTANAGLLNTEIGRSLQVLLRNLEAQTVALKPLPSVGAQSSDHRIMFLDIQLQTGRKDASKFEGAIKAAKFDRDAARGNEDLDRLEEAQKRLSEYEGGLEQCIAQMDSWEEERRAASTRGSSNNISVAEADFSTAEAVAAGLQVNWAQTRHVSVGKVPEPLALAARSIFRYSLRIMPLPGSKKLKWSTTANLPLRHGGYGTYELHGTLKNSLRNGSGERDPDLMARRYLLENTSYSEIGEEFAIDGSGDKNSHLVTSLKTWLAAPRKPESLWVPNPNLRRAILSASVSLRRTIYGLMNANNDALSELDPLYVGLIRDTYMCTELEWNGLSENGRAARFSSRWGLTWVSGTLTLPRRLMALVVQRISGSIALTEAISELGDLHANYKQLIELTYPRIDKGVTRPAFFARNYDRNDAPPVEERLILAPRCTREDCTARGAGKGRLRDRVRLVVAAHVLHVPEVPGGILCPHCLRVPLSDTNHSDQYVNARFPSDYFLAHSRGTSLNHDTWKPRIETALWAQPWNLLSAQQS